jgi:hypothetical protein
MENNFKQWNLDQRRLEFKEQKRQIISKAEQEKYAIQLKYQDDVRAINSETDRQLYAVSLEQAKFEDEYRAFRAAQIAAEEGGDQ